MKNLLIILPLFASASVFAQEGPEKAKQDSLHRADSIAQWKADSTRISNSSPLLRNKNQQGSTIQPIGPNNPEKKVKSDYTYDSDGRITGGNTNLTIKKKKKN